MPAPDDPAGIKAKLLAERAKLLESFANLSPETLCRSLGGNWSIRDVLAHLAMAESVNTRFAQMMVEKDSPLQLVEFAREYPDFPGEFELDKFNAWMTERWRPYSLEEILSALHRTRAETLSWLETLTPTQLARRGQHAAWGDLSVKDMFRILVLHDKSHRADIEKLKTS